MLYLSTNFEETFWKGKRILDLGCGSGLLGIYALKCGAKVDFQDYVSYQSSYYFKYLYPLFNIQHFQNRDVLETITMPNVLLNCKETSTDDEKLEQLTTECNFYAGDWSHFTELTNDLEKYDLILTSETIYNIENQQKLLDTFKERLRIEGIIFVAAKSHYFGVGGGLEQFVDVIKSGKVFKSKEVWQAAENLKRGIIELKFE